MHNDPHMYSWDGSYLDYHGTCRFVLAQPCDETAAQDMFNNGIPHLEIFNRNYRNPGCMTGVHRCPANVRDVTLKLSFMEFTLATAQLPYSFLVTLTLFLAWLELPGSTPERSGVVLQA